MENPSVRRSKGPNRLYLLVVLSTPRDMIRFLSALLTVLAFALTLGTATEAQARRIRVNIESSPPGATVYLDGTTAAPLGQTPIKRILVETGAHTLIFKLDGHQTLEMPINVRRWNETFKATLKPMSTIMISAGNSAANGASVRIDGEPGGLLPYKGLVEPGRHLIQVGKEGHQTFSQWVDLSSGQVLSLPVMLEKMAPDTGSILVAGGSQGAKVFLDGVEKGTSPTVLEDVSVGKHVVELRDADGAVQKEEVLVTAGHRSNATFAVERTTTSVRVISNAPDAMISIDGTEVGKAPLTKELKPGEHVVKGTVEGQEPVEEKVTLKEGDEQVVNIRFAGLVKNDGRIIINSPVGSAQISVDGVSRGAPPVVIEDAPAGTHTVVVSAQGYEDLRTTCDTAPGKNCEIVAELKPADTPIRVQANVPGAQLYVDGALQGPTPYEGQLPAGAHRIEVRANGYQTHFEQVSLVPSTSTRHISVNLIKDGELTPAEQEAKRLTLEQRRRGLTTHSAGAIPVNSAALDISVGYPYLLEARLGVGILDVIDAGFAVRTFGRLTEFELRGKFGVRFSDQISVGGQAKLGGGFGPGRDPKSGTEAANAEGHPVNVWFLKLEPMASLHFSEHGAFSLWLGFDFHTDRYDWSGANSDNLVCEPPNGMGCTGTEFERQDTVRVRLGGSLELVLNREWNLWGQLEGILAGNSRRVLGDFIINDEDPEFYFRLGGTYKF